MWTKCRSTVIHTTIFQTEEKQKEQMEWKRSNTFEPSRTKQASQGTILLSWFVMYICKVQKLEGL